MTTRSDNNLEVSGEDRRVIATIDAQFSPRQMTPAQRAAFCQKLEERIEGRYTLPWRLAIAATTALVVVALWGVVGRDVSTGRHPADASAQTESPVLYAYVDPDLYDESLRNGSALPDDYRVLAVAVDVPVNGALYSE
ncbi:MAG: hypothetical protein HY270_04670 [Deltaproteobacteria bacterium]|nr:hypothetical protein [Deltaproteobacteria bacterium]